MRELSLLEQKATAAGYQTPYDFSKEVVDGVAKRFEWAVVGSVMGAVYSLVNELAKNSDKMGADLVSCGFFGLTTGFFAGLSAGIVGASYAALIEEQADKK